MLYFFLLDIIVRPPIISSVTLLFILSLNWQYRSKFDHKLLLRLKLKIPRGHPRYSELTQFCSSERRQHRWTPWTPSRGAGRTPWRVQCPARDRGLCATPREAIDQHIRSLTQWEWPTSIEQFGSVDWTLARKFFSCVGEKQFCG